MIRVGMGYDVHRFNEGNHIILGGVNIPYEKGLEAHSDGDVVLHALADALLGAANTFRTPIPISRVPTAVFCCATFTISSSKKITNWSMPI